MPGIGLQDYVDEHRHERIGRGVRLVVLEQAKDDFAAVQDAYDLVPRRPVRLDLEQFWAVVSVEKVPLLLRESSTGKGIHTLLR